MTDAASPKSITDQLGYLIRVAQAAVWQDLVRAFKPFDIKPQQFAILEVVDGNVDCKQEFVARMLGIKRPNIVAFMDGLVKQDLVARRITSHDRRAHALSLTKEGKLLIDRLRAVDREHQARAAELIGSDRLPRLLDDLRRLQGLAETREPASDPVETR